MRDIIFKVAGNTSKRIYEIDSGINEIPPFITSMKFIWSN